MNNDNSAPDLDGLPPELVAALSGIALQPRAPHEAAVEFISSVVADEESALGATLVVDAETDQPVAVLLARTADGEITIVGELPEYGEKRYKIDPDNTELAEALDPVQNAGFFEKEDLDRYVDTMNERNKATAKRVLSFNDGAAEEAEQAA